jgi:hypothetical protein
MWINDDAPALRLFMAQKLKLFFDLPSIEEKMNKYPGVRDEYCDLRKPPVNETGILYYCNIFRHRLNKLT